MKKFQFSLEAVLHYKSQILDVLVGEHGAILAELRAQEQAVEAAEARYAAYNEEYRAAKAEGMTVADALGFQSGLAALETVIQKEKEKLAEIRRREEAKRGEVVEAKKETSSLEKLREAKLQSYNQAVQKSEEAFIDELVGMTKALNAQHM